MKSVFARISTAIVAVAAVAASALIATTPASATASTTNLTKISYQVPWQPGGSFTPAMDAVRADVGATYLNKNASSLVDTAITVNSLTTGLGTGQSMMDYAYIQFYSNADLAYNHQISFPDPCNNNQSTTGVQINQSSSTSCRSVTVPATTVAISISYTVAFNGQVGSYSNLIASGSTVTVTPRVYTGGSLVTATGLASTPSTPSGWYYFTDYNRANIEGYHTSVNLPAGVTSAYASITACVDFTGFHVASSSVFTGSVKSNGNVVTADGFGYAIVGASFPSSSGATLSGVGNSAPGTWETNHVSRIQAQGSFTVLNPSAGTFTPTLEVSNGTSSVVVSCAPDAPTAVGTLTSSMGSLAFVPPITYANSQSWTANVYRNDTNALVGQASGSGTTSSPVMGIYQQGAPPTTIPYGVPLYAKVSFTTGLYANGQTISFSSPLSTNQTPLYTLAAPSVTFPTDPSGLTTEGSAGITSDTLNYGPQVPTMSFMMDNSSMSMGPKRTPVYDDKNGYWYWNDNATPGQNQQVTGSIKLYHYTPAGVDTSFGGGNGVTIETTPNELWMTMGWVGDRDHWAAAVTTDATTYSNSGPTAWADYHYGLDVVTGAMNGTFSKKSYTYTEMDAFCDSVYPGSKLKNPTVTVVSNPTSDPWLNITCGSALDSNNVNAARVVYAKSTSAGLVALYAFNNTDPTVDNYAKLLGQTIYPNASAATDTAVAVTFATGKATTSSAQSGLSTAVVKRGLVRITKAGVATTLVGEAAWHEATASTSVSNVSSNTSFVSLPWLSANGSLLGLTRNGSNIAILNAGTSGGFATATSADNITFDENSVPAAFAMGQSLGWGRGGSNIVGLSTAPILTRTATSFGMTPSYNLAQAKLDWSTRKVSTQEKITYQRPMVSGVIAGTYVDTNGRLNFAYTKAENQLGFVRWVGAATLPDGVAVTSQSTSYVINAGGDVVLTGSGLGATSGATQVTSAKVNGVAATIKSRTATTLTITAPANNSATAQSPVTGNIELGFPGDQGGVVGQLTYVGADKLTPVITQTLSSTTAYFGDADRNLSVSVAMTPGEALTAVTATSSACSIVGGKVHFLAAGTCTVTSTLAGGSYYNSATPAVTTITVNKPTPTVTLNVGALTAFASDADRTITASATLDTNGTAPAPVLTATPATVCAIVSGKVHFVTSGNCVVTATIAASPAINGGSATQTIVVSKTTPTVTVSVAGASNALVGDDDRAITVAASAGTATVTSNTPLVCSIVPAVDQSPIKVHFIGAGSCIVKAQVIASPTINASTPALSTPIAVLLADSITADWADGDAPNKSATVDGAVLPVITVASGRDFTMTSADSAKCEVTADGLIWFKFANQNCVITITTGADTAVYAGTTFTWTIGMLPAIGADANSALQVPNNGVATKLATTALSWTQSSNSVKMNLYTKYVGLFKARMTFTDLNNTVQTCDVSFGSAAKVTGAAIKAVKTFTSPGFCTAAADAAKYTKFKALVASNTAQSEGTSVQVSYQFEKHYPNTGGLYPGELLLSNVQKTWSTSSFANLYFLAFDKITAVLPAATVASVSSDASGEVLPVVTLTSGRTDWTMTSADTTKCEVTADRGIWAKVANQTCVVTVATTGATAKWKAKSQTFSFPMVAAIGSNLASAPIAPSNGTAVNVGPLTINWTQASNSVVLKVNSRNVGLASAKMTFTPLATVAAPNPATITCTIASFGSAARVTTAPDAIKTQSSAKFCSGADLTAFTALVTARKSGAGQGVLPVTIAYKFEQHDPATGNIIGSALSGLQWSPDLVVKLNYRATAN